MIATHEPSASTQPLSVDLYRTGAFVAQTNFVQCVGASMQMMLNLIGPSIDTTAATQLRLFTLARSISDVTTAQSTDGTVLHIGPGASAHEWAVGLTQVGAGDYQVAALPSLQSALTVAARAMHETGRPVGLLVWQGQHAWVMDGFTSTADPSTDPGAQVTGARILDPLYPYPSGSWGQTPPPNSLLSVARLAQTFVPYRPHGRIVALRGRFVIVMPYERTVVPGIALRSR